MKEIIKKASNDLNNNLNKDLNNNNLKTNLEENNNLQFKTEKSKLDNSVNFISELNSGAFEARYVRRENQELIVYLSSHTGCNKACRFCHLTQSGQTSYVEATNDNYINQAKIVLDYYQKFISKDNPAQIVNYNFMSRGEVLANNNIINYGDEIINNLDKLALEYNLKPRAKLSTIMPREIKDLEISDIFKLNFVDIYYSLYSTDDKFRKKWMPKALDLNLALEKLYNWQKFSRKISVIHFALIENENDSYQDFVNIIKSIKEYNLRVDFNLVRYNPFDKQLGAESTQLEIRAKELKEAFPESRIQIVGRVGYDVKASCGMFINSQTTKRHPKNSSENKESSQSIYY